MLHVNPALYSAPIVGAAAGALGAFLGRLMPRPSEQAKTKLDVVDAAKSSIEMMISANAELREMFEAQRQHLNQQDQTLREMRLDLGELRGYIADLCGLLREHNIPVPPLKRRKATA